jgi:hypothetical protein
MKLSLFALAAAAAVLFSAPAHAQPGVVTMQFDTAEVKMQAAGFSPVDEMVRGTLEAGADEEYELELGDGSYVVVAYCDNSCTDIDLVLSQGGREVDSDVAADDYPVVTVENQPGTYVLTVRMATCEGDCHYGVRVFRQQ